MSTSDAIISAASGLIGAGIGGFVSYRVAGEFWRRERLEATAPLVEARIEHFAGLWELTDSGDATHVRNWDRQRLEMTVEDMRRWFYTDAAGLLLSDAARRQWSHVVDLLREQAARAESLSDEQNETIRKAMTCLRTRLKQDVHVHGPMIDDESCRDQPGWLVPGGRSRHGAFQRLRHHG